MPKSQSEKDQEMYAKGYHYRCDPVDTDTSPYIPLYAQGLKMVNIILTDWPKQRFNVVCLIDSSVKLKP